MAAIQYAQPNVRDSSDCCVAPHFKQRNLDESGQIWSTDIPRTWPPS